MILPNVELQSFLTERNAALIALDEAYVAKMVPGCPADMRLTVLHKARYECKAIAADYRHASGAWLRANGLRRSTGEPLLPEGELPE